ncbi:hypothetical protein JX265_000755 [Neoarthrinium moseri]|uniref:Secreted protein n=1 Tax=Neoarthrinium moseri TaxID=1658444 RepID=A0A9P9WWJ5_9PEZI|nr:uncharacterized protein JN550_007138 [Neoarthrinium moseri]KAI1867407.1 hypothetical protein JN550_007138 [Neoarthrinium moseri]KAI1880515.1 hypothetical protein JX265_000755 [Neoarthrinium moseri]
MMVFNIIIWCVLLARSTIAAPAPSNSSISATAATTSSDITASVSPSPVPSDGTNTPDSANFYVDCGSREINRYCRDSCTTTCSRYGNLRSYCPECASEETDRHPDESTNHEKPDGNTNEGKSAKRQEPLH